MSCPHVNAPKVACGHCALCARAAGITPRVPPAPVPARPIPRIDVDRVEQLVKRRAEIQRSAR